MLPTDKLLQCWVDIRRIHSYFHVGSVVLSLAWYRCLSKIKRSAFITLSMFSKIIAIDMTRVSSLKGKDCQFDNFVVIGGTVRVPPMMTKLSNWRLLVFSVVGCVYKVWPIFYICYWIAKFSTMLFVLGCIMHILTNGYMTQFLENMWFASLLS